MTVRVLRVNGCTLLYCVCVCVCACVCVCVQPAVCTRELCVFSFYTLGVMSGAVEEVATGAEVTHTHTHVHTRTHTPNVSWTSVFLVNFQSRSRSVTVKLQTCHKRVTNVSQTWAPPLPGLVWPAAGGGPAGGHVQNCTGLGAEEHHLWPLPLRGRPHWPQEPGLQSQGTFRRLTVSQSVSSSLRTLQRDNV